ncbi:hypothetical protein [Rhizobium sp. BK376]|uniref:ribonuclease toxin HepT-like protein n=1 Tax=Rhizobium sp. BK376 TaxID=2512149 RepID=UPI0010E22B6D|nr:hypothetical protein [Rhizobium sp. BK376]TCR91791.1 uncharacterized protein YutE (UPF0331/DUF86 family) [Rhizobium sp. BK376]
MASFSLPVFSRLSPKIARAEHELAQMAEYYASHSDQVAAGDWGAMGAVSSGVHNVYNGIEDILLSIARDVDDSVPAGPSAHQDVLDQMAAQVAGTRPALLDTGLYEALVELKGFRHLVRHRYGFDLKPEKVIENLDLLQKVFPAFIEAVVELEKIMREGDDLIPRPPR